MLLLDEPSEGIQPSIVDQISEILKKINAETGLTILIVEHNFVTSIDTQTRCAFMEKGQIVETCSIEDIRKDESIIKCRIAV